MPTKTTGKGLQKVISRVRYITDPVKPRPWVHAAKGFREEEEKTRGARNNLFIYESRFCLLMTQMDSQVSKSCFKTAALNTVPHVCTRSASLSHSDRQISSNKLFQLYTYFHLAMRSVAVAVLY